VRVWRNSHETQEIKTDGWFMEWWPQCRSLIMKGYDALSGVSARSCEGRHRRKEDRVANGSCYSCATSPKFSGILEIQSAAGPTCHKGFIHERSRPSYAWRRIAEKLAAVDCLQSRMKSGRKSRPGNGDRRSLFDAAKKLSPRVLQLRLHRPALSRHV
jgi:hypothetical protein